MKSSNLTRQDFLSVCSLSGLSLLWPSWISRLAFSPAQQHSLKRGTAGTPLSPRGDVLVVIFLRGAADGLNLVVPHGDPAYYALRPSLGIPRPDDSKALAKQRAINLDGFFGLHPALQPLLEVWQEQHLAIVHACGAPDLSRSHFKSMELMERGVEDGRGPASGWVSRHLASIHTAVNLDDSSASQPVSQSPLRAVGFGMLPQRSLGGSVPVTALRSIVDFHYERSPEVMAQMRAALGTLYQVQNHPTDQRLNTIGLETLQMLDVLQKLDPLAYQPELGAGQAYPNTEFGLGLKQTAMLIKSELGLEVAAIDLGGWDTHFAQGSSEGIMANLASELAQGLAALHSDLHYYMRNLTVVVMTEFGRRAHENGSLGTDHGHGSLMMLLGGHVNGGQVYGRWPGLADEQLFGPGDLAITTDYRDILAEICLKRLYNPALGEIFPGFTRSPVNIVS
jgi:uncharacterized protein (DUF1501 family)